MDDERVISVEERRREEINEIGRAVKVARNGRGWSLRRLADEAGLSASLISAVETGKIVPTVGSLFAISDALGQPAETFFPARRRTTGSEPHDRVELRPAPGVDEPGPGPESDRPVEASWRGIEPNPRTVSSQPTSRPATTTPPPHRAFSIGNAAPLMDQRLEAARSATRSIVRPARVVSRRASPTAGAGVPPVGPTSDDFPPSGLDQPTATVGQAAPVRPGRRGGSPGVAVRRFSERPTMLLDDGSTWTLPVEVTAGIGAVVEVSPPLASGTPPMHRARDRTTTLLVTHGRLHINAAFVETVLETGDSVVISAGVPHRLTAGPQHPATYLAFVAGEWDGTL